MKELQSLLLEIASSYYSSICETGFKILFYWLIEKGANFLIGIFYAWLIIF